MNISNIFYNLLLILFGLFLFGCVVAAGFAAYHYYGNSYKTYIICSIPILIIVCNVFVCRIAKDEPNYK